MPVNKYEQISDILEGEVASPDVSLGSRFLSDNQIAERFGVAPLTARQAMACLSSKGLVVRRRGVGTFVKTKPPLNPPYRVTLLFPGEWATDPQRTRSWHTASEYIAGMMDRLATLRVPFHAVPCDADADGILDISVADSVERDEAVAVMGISESRDAMRLLFQKRCSVVVVGTEPGQCEWADSASWVTYDRTDALRQVAHHLIKQGCKDIVAAGFTTGMRVADFRRVFREEHWPGGIAFRACGAEEKAGRALVVKLAEDGELGDAVFFWSRPSACGGLQGLRSAGIKVPEDVCVVAVQGAEGPVVSSDPITTVMTEPKKVGGVAAQELAQYVLSKEWTRTIRKVMPYLAVAGTSERRKETK